MEVETTPTGAAIDRERIAELTRAEQDKLKARTKGSHERWERARSVMPGGVPSSFQSIEPWPVFVERGEGSKVWDVDGNEYSDFHNGFGVVVVGHGNPHVTAAVQKQAAQVQQVGTEGGASRADVEREH